MLTVDLIIDARWVLPINPAGAILRNYSLVIDADRILALAPTASVNLNYHAATRCVRGQHVLMPGFVNAHAHAAMALLPAAPLRSPVAKWLRESIWPQEKRWVNAEFVRTGTQLALLDMLRLGITCCADMYLFPEEAARVAREWRLRLAVGLPIADGPSSWATSADEYLNRSADLYDEWRGDPLVTPYFAPHAPYTVSNATLERLRRAADQLDAPIAMHLHESRVEIEQSLHDFGQRPIDRLAALGLLRPGFTAIHAVECNADDIAQLASHGVGIVHCPSSNLRLGCGFAPLLALREAGLGIGLGSDGPVSATRPDILAEARLANLLASGLARQACSLEAHASLRSATLGGAQVLGLDDRIGSLEAGKEADVVAIQIDSVADDAVAEQLLFHTQAAESVSDVWVAGRALRLQRQWQGIDPQPTYAEKERWQARMARDAA